MSSYTSVGGQTTSPPWPGFKLAVSQTHPKPCSHNDRPAALPIYTSQTPAGWIKTKRNCLLFTTHVVRQISCFCTSKIGKGGPTFSVMTQWDTVTFWYPSVNFKPSLSLLLLGSSCRNEQINYCKTVIEKQSRKSEGNVVMAVDLCGLMIVSIDLITTKDLIIGSHTQSEIILPPSSLWMNL